MLAVAQSRQPMFARATDFVVTKLLDYIGTQRFLTIQLDITNACNLKCIHCYHPHHQNDGAMSYEGWLNILDQYLIPKLSNSCTVKLGGII